MVALSVTKARALAGEGATVAILASPAVRRVALFDGPMAAAGLNPLYAADEQATLGAIRSIKAHGPTEASRAALQAASAELLARGARVQMVACTEFSLIADAVAEGTTAFDTLDVLVAEIVAFSLGRT
jgi:aspartate racemase